MPSRFHDGARRSRLPDREAARRGRGLDGRQRRRDQDCGGTPLVFMRLVAALIAIQLASSFSACGVTRNSTGLLVVLRWSCVALSGTGWSLLGALVFELIV